MVPIMPPVTTNHRPLTANASRAEFGLFLRLSTVYRQRSGC